MCNKLARIRSDPLYEIKISLPVMGAENTNFYSDDPGRVVFFDLLGRPKEGERMKIVCAPSAFFIRFISGARIVSDLRGVVAAMDPDPNFFRDFAPYGVTIM